MVTYALHRKIKLDTYEVLTRSHTSGSSIYHNSVEDLYRIGKTLLEKELISRYKIFDSDQTPQGCKGVRDLRLRLMGLRATNLRDEDASSKGATVKNALSNVNAFGEVVMSGELTQLHSGLTTPQSQRLESLTLVAVTTNRLRT